MSLNERAETSWKRGRFDSRRRPPALLFGRMHEDWGLEASLFPPSARVFCIASAGCTALALAARGARVTAVDVNPVQVDYVRSRLAGLPPREGSAERLLRSGRFALKALGVRGKDLERFLLLSNPAEQVRFWKERLDGPAWRIGLGLASSPLLLRAVYSEAFVAALPARFGKVLMKRLERGFATHSNRANPYAWRLLLGREPPGLAPSHPSGLSLTLSCGDAVEYLEGSAPSSFDAFTLSNITDGADAAYGGRLLRAIERAAAPNALIVLRSFAEPRDAEEDHRAAGDRSFLWGRIAVRGSDVLRDLF